MVDNLSIAYGTTIDSAIGGSVNDVFSANAGSDTIDGGGGTDNIVYLPQPRADYVYTRIGRDIELTGTLDANGTTEKLRNVQTVAFSDITLDSSSLGSIVWTGTGGDNFYDNINNWDLHQLPAV